jgi:hypothetical protein
MIDDDDRRTILLTRLRITARHFRSTAVQPAANDNAPIRRQA